MRTTLKLVSHRWIFLVLILASMACERDQQLSLQPINRPIKVVKLSYLPTQHDDPNSPMRSTPPVLYRDTLYYYINGYQTEYRYDVMGRLTFDEEIYLNRPDPPYGVETSTYTYKGNTVLFQGKRNTQTYVLNDKGYLTVPDGYYPDAQLGYEYDQQGYLLKLTTSYSTVIQEIDNGNITKRVETEIFSYPELGKATVAVKTTTYEYDLSRPALVDPHPIYKGWVRYGGERSKNLLIKSSILNTCTGCFTQRAPYTITSGHTYSFDTYDRVTEQTSLETVDDGSREPVLTITHFTYPN